MSKESLANKVACRLISKLLEEKDFTAIANAGISSKYFNGTEKRVFDFIMSYKKKFGGIPSNKLLERKYPGFVFMDDTDDTLAYYCEMLRNRNIIDTLAVNSEKLSEMYVDVAEDDENYDPEKVDEFLKQYKQPLLKIYREYIVGDCVEIGGENALDRWNYYLERKKGDGLFGIPTGFEIIDYISGGVQQTDLWTFLGYTNVGKTFLLCIIADNLAAKGYKVVLITREMTAMQLSKRVDAIHNRFNYTDFNRGFLSEEKEAEYVAYLKKMQKEDYPLYIEKSTGGVSQMAALIDKYSPHILLVDGAYLMTEDSDEKDWNRLNSTWIDMKNLCLSSNVPIINTMQLKSQKADLDNIAMAKYISQSCDVMFGMEAGEDERNNRQVKMKSLKQRESENIGTFTLAWNFAEMDWGLEFHSVPGYDEWKLRQGSKRLGTDKKENKEKGGLKFKKRLA